tara:strand:- start:7373 stop:8011 length:639 start_codon:yes stop_codon:yes gene_type:complete
MKFFIIIKENSERIPNKNFIKLGDKPLWRHLIDELEDESVYIDTDSSIILNERIKNVTIYERDIRHVELENDNEFKVSPVLLMIERFLDTYVTDLDELIVTPHVTSPFIKKDTIIKASKYIGEYETVQACTEHKEFGYYKNNPINFDPSSVSKTQDLDPIIMGNGAFFIFTKRSFMKNKNRSGDNVKFYSLTFKESIEIDYPEDLEIAKKFI